MTTHKKPLLKLLEGGAGAGKVDQVEIPERHDFDCPRCGKPCVMWPRTKPIAVQHSLPTCKAWKQIEGLPKDRVDGKKRELENFLIEAGVWLLVPQQHDPN